MSFANPGPVVPLSGMQSPCNGIHQLGPLTTPLVMNNINYMGPKANGYIAYVPIYIDMSNPNMIPNQTMNIPEMAMPNQMANMNLMCPPSFLPTMGLNRALHQWNSPPVMMPNGTGFDTIGYGMQPPTTDNKVGSLVSSISSDASDTASDSASDSGSVSASPQLRPLQPHRVLDPSEAWADANERLMENISEVSQQTEFVPSQPPKKVKKKKYGYRSKQNKIDTVYVSLTTKYYGQGILVDDDEVLRGPDVIRLHVKKYDALCSIEEALEAVESKSTQEIAAVSIPLSMKNTFQRKGFLVYIKLASVSMIPEALDVLHTFAQFKKCGIAKFAKVSTQPEQVTV